MTDMTPLIILAAVGVGGALVLMAVALGGILVFRTKRESHEPLFKLSQPKGEIFSLDDLEQPAPARRPRGKIVEGEDDGYPDMQSIMGQNSRFMSQFVAQRSTQNDS